MDTGQLEREQRALVRDYHRAFGCEEGKRVLAHLEKTFGVGLSSVIPSDTGRVDPYLTHFKEGQKDAVRFIRQILIQMPLDDEEADASKPTVTRE